MTQTQKKYSTKNLTTQFTLDSLHCSVTYLAQEKKKYSVIPVGYLANIQVTIDEKELNREFDIPLSKKKGSEIKNLEDTLYSLIDESIRNVAQKKLAVRNETNTFQTDNAFFDPNIKMMQSYLASKPLQTEDDSLFSEYRKIIELTNHLIQSIVYVTQLQEITKEGFIAYQEKTTDTFNDEIKDETKNGINDETDKNINYKAGSEIKSEIKTAAKEASIQKITRYMRHKVNPQSDVKEMQKQVLAYLEHAARGDKTTLTGEQAKIIVEDFVPQYVILRDKTYLAAFPKNLADHGLNSLWEGGVIGGIGLTIAEWITNMIFRTHLNLPCFGIGAGTAFIWPGVKMIATPYYRYKEKKEFERLISETNTELQTVPSHEKSLVAYVEEKRIELDSISVKKVFLKTESSEKGKLESIVHNKNTENQDIDPEEQKDRKKIFENDIAQILKMYRERKGESDTLAEVREAVTQTKQTFLETKIPFYHLPIFIHELDFGEREVSSLSEGVSELMKALYSPERYEIEQIRSLLIQVKESADVDCDSPNTIAEEVIALLE